MDKEKGFYWQRNAEIEALLLEAIRECAARNPDLARFEKKLPGRTSTRLLDWVDHIMMPDSSRWRASLEQLGFLRQPAEGVIFFLHPGVLLPGIVLVEDDRVRPCFGVVLRVESIGDFLQANSLSAPIQGSPYSPFRRAELSVHDSAAMQVVERRKSHIFEPVSLDHGYLRDYLDAVETWQNQPRGRDDEEQDLAAMIEMAGQLAARLGPEEAAHIVCSCERQYWQARNHAGRMQKSRQDTVGLGWANHDHHTFRSSRRHFARLVDLFNRLGFQKRERFYAGREAGWGAQVMENSSAGLVLFLDVDLAPDEVAVDFTGQPLPPLEKLGTVGLWCELHGDSILGAGMHHLAARFVFDRLIEDIAGFNVRYMAPFSNFSYLKQAFSRAEQWQVAPARLERLLAAGTITERQAEAFGQQGAVGSHLENIERREGYKGFNKKNVSAIIRETDPRRQGGGR